MVHLEHQIDQCLHLLRQVISNDLLGVYLYGSATHGGLKKYSDIDLLVVIAHSTSRKEREQLVSALLQISGIYMKSDKPPIELTIVVESEVNPWRYPPKFDFQYGEWLREEFESGNVDPWQTKNMPDLALLITQAQLSNKPLFGPPANNLLPQIPYTDFVRAMIEELPTLIESLESDTRNVLLTLSRVWHTLETDTIHSKHQSANWTIPRLPEELHQVLLRAKGIYLGEEVEYWEDLNTLIKPCADFIFKKINLHVSTNPPSEDDMEKGIKIE